MLTLRSILKEKGTCESFRSSGPSGLRRRTVTIEYCVPGNYQGVARRLAEALRLDYGVRSTLVPSRDGVFEVSVDGRLVYSKKATLRFPETDEISYHVENGPS